MGLLDEAPPRTVELAGRDVPIGWGWRAHVRVDTTDVSDDRGCWRALRLMFCGPSGELPAEVAQDPAGAVAAGLAWHNAGWACMRYGKARKAAQQARRVLDLDADAAIVTADFRRLYGIDLDGSRMHWWRFCELLTSAARTDGSLLNQAVSARLISLAGLKGERRRQAQRLRDAWALPPTRSEAEGRAAAEFRRG